MAGHIYTNTHTWYEILRASSFLEFEFQCHRHDTQAPEPSFDTTTLYILQKMNILNVVVPNGEHWITRAMTQTRFA